MILLRVSEDWRDYLNYLEEEFSMLVSKWLSVQSRNTLPGQVDRGFYANVKGPQFEGDVEVHYLDIRNLQILTDKLQRLRQILSLNIRLCTQMKDSMASIRMGSPEDLSIPVDRTQAKLNKFLYDQQTSLDRIQTLILSSTGFGQLVSWNTQSFISIPLTNHTGNESFGNSSCRSKQADERWDAEAHWAGCQREQAHEKAHWEVNTRHQVHDDHRLDFCHFPPSHLFCSKDNRLHFVFNS